MYQQFSGVYDLLMQEVDYDAWASYLTEILEERDIVPGKTILECACGTGELTWRLADAGYRMIASDLSSDMLRIAQEKCRNKGLRIPFVEQAMEELSCHKAVDAIVAACDGVNYLTEESQLLAFFNRAYAALRPGGIILFDVSSQYKLSTVLGCNTFGEDGKDVAYLWKNMYDEESRLLELNLSFFVRKGQLYERFEEQQIQRAYSRDELLSALESAGFINGKAYAFGTKDAPCCNTERIQLIGRKPL